MIELLRMTDHELADRCTRGDRLAQQQVYRQYAPRMFAVCCRYLSSRADAEDALISAFTRVFDGIGGFRHEGSFEGWIRRIVVNEALQVLRRNRRFMRHTGLETAEDEVEAAPVPDTLGANELLALVSEMPEGYRAVFNLYAIDGYSHAEIAESLGISEGTSKSQLNKGRRWLQQRIEGLEKMSERKISSDGKSV